jgi:glycosyltransferase involved in cell wall biosynthesis
VNHHGYIVITPARDEEGHIERTITSMVAQTVRPRQWVIVNDGSTDGTAAILDAAARDHDWITAVHRNNRGFRAAGSGVMEAFYSGLDAIEIDDWEFLTKFDADLSFAPEYFEKCLGHFEKNPKLGIGGGIIYNLVDGEEVLEEISMFHVRGATKIYRRTFWEDLGGLVKLPGWDTLDEVKAQMLGWETYSFPEVKLVQLRFTGDAAGQWSNWRKNGRASYICGYHPMFIMAKSIRRVVQRPYIVGSLGLLQGYFGAAIRREKQIDDPELIQFVRREQLKRLSGRRSVWR